MTVQELINQLETVKDKSKEITVRASHIIEKYDYGGIYNDRETLKVKFEHIAEKDKVIIDFIENDNMIKDFIYKDNKTNT